MCLWDAQFNAHIVQNPRAVALTTSWAEILPANPLRVGLYITADTANRSFWWPDERTGSTGTGIILSANGDQPIHFFLAQHGRMPGRVWYARIATAGATVFIVEQFIPAWLAQRIQQRQKLDEDEWQRTQQ